MTILIKVINIIVKIMIISIKIQSNKLRMEFKKATTNLVGKILKEKVHPGT